MHQAQMGDNRGGHHALAQDRQARISARHLNSSSMRISWLYFMNSPTARAACFDLAAICGHGQIRNHWHLRSRPNGETITQVMRLRCANSTASKGFAQCADLVHLHKQRIGAALSRCLRPNGQGW